ncbi:hypothetical protein B0J14DRAFT_482166 [Halenospora varia]|nr:hypothetical protein B0J14DRAFT_482166 [Halenospora varia]
MRLRALPFLSISHLKGEETDSSHVNEYSTSQARDNQDGGGITSISVFEQRFFALPGDLQEQIIASLSIPDIMNLRATSKDWHNLVSVNETPIIRAFLNQNVIPRFAVSLYSVPHPTAINLHYVCSLRHRLLVSSRLSTMMAEWIANEIFLRRTEAERLEFLPQQARMYYRLVPLLCTIFHFFENFRHLHLEYVLGHNQNLPLGSHALRAIELKIMSTYSNELLLEVHQIFPLFISFLCRKLRPPSYIGRLERSLIGYYKKAPSDHIIAAIFCIGGLREVARFSRIQAYEQRRTAVDLWYDSISTQPISPRNGAGPLSSPLRRVHRRKDPRSENTTLKGKATSERNSVLTQSSASERVDPESLGYKGSSVFDTGLAAGPPMGLLPAESMMRLLPALPALQKIWVSTAESLLLERRVVERKQDIKRNAQVFLSLITEGVTDADVLFYGDAVDDIL